MKVILCTLLLVAVLSQQTRAEEDPCHVPVPKDECHGSHSNVHYIYNMWDKSCMVIFKHTDELCGIETSHHKCKKSGIKFQYLPATNECHVRKA